jgi:plasmid stabilization system protein ParE
MLAEGAARHALDLLRAACREWQEPRSTVRDRARPGPGWIRLPVARRRRRRSDGSGIFRALRGDEALAVFASARQGLRAHGRSKARFMQETSSSGVVT